LNALLEVISCSACDFLGMSILQLQGIFKQYGQVQAVSDANLAIEKGELFGLLGPSGCGKTTMLRVIAGLESPDSGGVEFEGRDITNLPSEKRGFGMVFQNYALFPHLNVFENVAFGLRARRRVSSPTVTERSPRDINQQVARALDLVQLPGFEKRRVDELSGGQQQRVAIARAIAIEPALLLFDEPLSNLDVALREETRRELRSLVKRLGLTAVYVTHDQEEAFALCDRIAVMSAGQILQIGAPRDLYDHPTNLAVTRFLGHNNLIRAVRLTASTDPVTKFKTLAGGHTLVVNTTHDQLMHLPVNKPCLLSIRPEAIGFLKINANVDNEITARVDQIEFAGATTTVTLDANGLRLEALVLRADGLAVGEHCIVSLPREQIRLLAEA
jgi:ABC-type Fe3+/spermidine/putrescine transport system ATPase subunit